MRLPLSRQYVVRVLLLLLMFGAGAVAIVFVAGELRVCFNESRIDDLCQDARQYMMLHQNDSAIASLARAEHLLTEDTDPLVRGKVYARIGYFYKSQADYERAIVYGRQALDANRAGETASGKRGICFAWAITFALAIIGTPLPWTITAPHGLCICPMTP